MKRVETGCGDTGTTVSACTKRGTAKKYIYPNIKTARISETM